MFEDNCIETFDSGELLGNSAGNNILTILLLFLDNI